MPKCLIRTSAPKHNKFFALATDLGINRTWAFGLAARLWCLCWEHQLYDGRLDGWSIEYLAEELSWPNDPKVLAEAMLKRHLLDKQGDVLVVHDFSEEQGALIKKLMSERKGGRPSQGDKPKPPGAAGDDTVVKLCLDRMREAKTPGTPKHHRNMIQAWRARGITGADIDAAIMNNPGKGVFELEKILIGSNGGTPTRSSAQEILDKWAKDGDARDAAAKAKGEKK